MTKRLHVGCDAHDQWLVIHLSAHLSPLPSRRYLNLSPERQLLIEHLRDLARQSGCEEIVFGYEASGLGYGLYDDLQAAGIQCQVLAPTLLQRSVKDSRNKTDHQDAERILKELRGHYLAGNELPAIWVPDAQTRDDRELTRARLENAEKITQVKNQTSSLLKRHDLRRPEEIKTKWSQADQQWLRALTRETAPLGPGARLQLSQFLDRLDLLQAQQKELDAQLQALAESPRYAASAAALQQRRGVGLITAMVYLTELGDPTRFHNRREIAAYWGLAPAADESGQRCDHKGHITRQGSSRVRRVLNQAVWAFLNWGSGSRDWFDALVARRGKKIAVVAAMRKLSIALWHTAVQAKQQATTA